MLLERLTTAQAPARVDTCLSQQAQLGEASCHLGTPLYQLIL